jgi:hypothetical protein
VLDPLVCGQGWLPLCAGLDPVDGDADDDGADDSEVVDALCVGAVVAAAPLVAASATPVAPAPSPPAITAVMISRRTRAPVLETMSLLLPGEPSVARRIWRQPARRAWHGPEG